jgi:small-conductance mechanosensitive channel
LLSRVVGRRIFTRLGMTPGAASAVQTISFYILLTVFGFLSLELANVPLTIFTFLGGAVAIGVGFGSQTLMNNFISGLILLAERPVRVGDLVDIDGVNGTIEYIGARSTRVKTGANLEILVPNSQLLENKVTNWTLSDSQIRIMVGVGVAYGSPTRNVAGLLRQAVTDNPDVLSTPEPLILFKEFGDNALNFEVHFWVQMRTVMQGERVASEVRHAIDDLLARANITIAFPQRDVHLDSVKPLEVNVRQITQDRLGDARLREAA